MMKNNKKICVLLCALWCVLLQSQAPCCDEQCDPAAFFVAQDLLIDWPDVAKKRIDCMNKFELEGARVGLQFYAARDEKMLQERMDKIGAVIRVARAARKYLERFGAYTAYGVSQLLCGGMLLQSFGFDSWRPIQEDCHPLEVEIRKIRECLKFVEYRLHELDREKSETILDYRSSSL